MSDPITDLQKDIETKLAELRAERDAIIKDYKQKLEEAKIEQLKRSILEK